MLSPERKKQWLNATWRLSVVWTFFLGIGYILHYGWMGWPAVVVRENVPFISTISLSWWRVFILQAIYPALNSLIFLLAKILYDKKKMADGDDIGIIIIAIGILGILGLIIGDIIGLIIGLIIGDIIGASAIIIIAIIIIRKKYLPHIGKWLIGK